ncbi:hypothetical protein BH10CHL1_BH10CHL1_14620 [soil metagenome]
MFTQISHYEEWRRSAVGKLVALFLVLQVICPPAIIRAQNLIQPTMPTSVADDASLYLPLVTNSNQTPASVVPSILSFNASADQIQSGATSTLLWSVNNATSVSIAGIGRVTGTSLVVTPTTTTEYILTAANQTRTTTAHTTITVMPADHHNGVNVVLPYQQTDGGNMTDRVPEIAVDSAGGIHTIYTANWTDSAGQRPAYYAYCASNCNNTASFSRLSLGDQVVYAELALDSQGHPRVLLTVSPNPSESTQYQYVYGECNTAAPCTDWILTPLLAAPLYQHTFYPDVERNQSFALDSQGRPGLLYFAHEGYFDPGAMFYTYCDGDCTAAADWPTVKLADDEWRDVTLAFTHDGTPKIAADLIAHDENRNPIYQFGYFECSDHTCSSVNGGALMLRQQSSATSPAVFALRLTANGQPRIAFYSGSGEGGTLVADKLYYLACDEHCVDDASSSPWRWLTITLPAQDDKGNSLHPGENGVDLALDAQDRPRIALRYGGASIDELAYSWCNAADCVAASVVWNYKVLFSTQATDQEFGHSRASCPTCLPPIPDCVSFWDGGYWPSLTLDTTGQPRIAYEVQLVSGGGCSVERLARIARVAIFDQP